MTPQALQAVNASLAPDRTREDLSWQARGLCRKMADPDAFFARTQKEALPAKRVCLRCPVRPVCLDYGLRHPSEAGVWGGTTQADRTRMHRTALRREAAPKEAA